MKKLNLNILSLLLLGSSAFAMNQPEMLQADEARVSAMAQTIAKSLQPLSQEGLAEQVALKLKSQAEVARFKKAIAQSEKRQRAAFTPQEAARQENVANMLSEAFSQLPHNAERTDAEQKRFKQRLRNELPQVLQSKIGKFAYAPESEYFKFMYQSEMFDVVSCLLPRHGNDLPIDKMVEESFRTLKQFCFKLNDLDAQHSYPQAETPYIIAMCGYWSFKDEPSKFRCRSMEINEAQTTDSDIWLAHRYDQNNAIVNKITKDEFRLVLYSNGRIEIRLHPLRRAQSKMLPLEQWELMMDIISDPKNVTPEQILACRSLPLFARVALKSNYEIVLTKTDEFRHKLANYSSTGLKCAGAAVCLGSVAYLTSRHVSFPMKYPEIKDTEKEVMAFFNKTQKGLVDEAPIKPLIDARHSVRKLWYVYGAFAWHALIKGAQGLLPMVLCDTGLEIEESMNNGRDRYRYPGNKERWDKIYGFTGKAIGAGFVYAACRGAAGYFASKLGTQPGN